MAEMRVSVASGTGLMREMTVDLPSEELAHEVDKRLQDYARTARIPGFRPGKVPLGVLRKRYEGALRDEVLQEMVQSSLAQAIAQERLQPAGRPELEFYLDPAAGRYSYKARFEVLPHIELQNIADVTIKRPVATITPEDIDAMIERLRRQYGTWQETSEREARIGDRVKVALEGRVDGEPLSGDKTEITIELGAGRLIAGFDDHLVGARVGEERQFDLRFPENYRDQNLAGREAHFSVRLNQIFALSLPEVNAEFIAYFGIADGDMARFRDELEKTMARELTNRITARIKTQVFDALLAANPIELPCTLVEAEKQLLKKQNPLADQERWGFSEAFFDQLSRHRVALNLLIEEASKRYELRVSETAVRAKVEELAANYENPQQFVTHYLSDKGKRAQIEWSVMEDLLVQRLLEHAHLVDEPSSFDELIMASSN